MRIALLGGAFNPPHIGHQILARQVFDFGGVDQIWLLPNYGQLPPKPVAPVSDRLQMIKYLESPNIIVSTIEIDNKLDGQTINLLPHLPAGNEYVFVIGADQLPVFHLWGRWQELLSKMPFLVFPRFGYPSEPLYDNMKLLSNELLIVSDISSTKIRDRVAKGLSISEFVPGKVEKYIKNHRLYL